MSTLLEVVVGFVGAVRVQLLDVAERAKSHSALAALRSDSCLFRSEPAEPVFVLCARDPDAIECIEVWCALRRVKLAEARELLGVDGATPGTIAYGKLERMRQKIHDAANAGQAFESWAAGAKRRAQGG
jgi:hypothetical protein